MGSGWVDGGRRGGLVQRGKWGSHLVVRATQDGREFFFFGNGKVFAKSLCMM